MAAGPGVSMAIYLTITTIYFLIKIFVSSIDSMALTISYFCLIILGQFFINVDITKTSCGKSNFGVAMMASTIPWIFVLGSLTVMLTVFPGWLIPFSNTIGYVIAAASGVSTLFNDILVPEMEQTGATTSSAALKTLEHIYNNKSLLINELTRSNLPKFWDNMKSANIIEKNAGKVNPSLYDTDLKAESYDGDEYVKFTKLFNFIRMKDLVSEFIWYALTGTLVCSISYNYIQNVGCSKSVDEMKQTHDDYLQQEQEIADKKKADDGAPKTIYKSYE